MAIVRNQIFDSVVAALSSLAQRAKWRRLVPALGGRFEPSAGTMPWKT